MPPIYPPSLIQVSRMKDTIKKCKSFKITIDDDFIIDSFTNFIIWDDDAKMIHAICENTSLATQFDAPYKIRSAPYDKIESFTYEL